MQISPSHDVVVQLPDAVALSLSEGSRYFGHRVRCAAEDGFVRLRKGGGGSPGQVLKRNSKRDGDDHDQQRSRLIGVPGAGLNLFSRPTEVQGE